MERAEAPDKLAAVDRDDFALGEQFLHHRFGPGIVAFVAEDGQQHGLIRDIKIRVARGQPLAVADDFRRAWAARGSRAGRSSWRPQGRGPQAGQRLACSAS